jgi:hypothetical protein
MSDGLTDALVRQWLRDHAGQVYCADCLASALGHPDTQLIRTTLGEVAHEQMFWAGPCLCGETGLRYGW